MPEQKKRKIKQVLSFLGFAFLIFILTCFDAVAAGEKPVPKDTAFDWKKVEEAFGKTGVLQADGIFKISLPRYDLKVTVKDVQIKPALALGSWVAFKRMGGEVMVMGDMVLTQDEVSPVMMKLQEGGVEQTALHNHLLNESPRVMYMHIQAHGDPVKIAQAIRSALALSKTPFAAESGNYQSQNLEFDIRQIDLVIGYKGKLNGGVYQFGIPRAEKIMEGGMEIPPSMGMSISINFQPTGGGKAAIAGDFVLAPSEVNPVIRALREHGIEVTAIHSHMLTEEPRMFFLHFWANDDAVSLAHGLRAALDRVNIAR